MTKPLGPATIKVGTVEVPGRAALAPLAGYTEYPFRAAVARFGCAFAVTPLISAEGLVRRNEKTTRLLATGDDDASVVAAQIFGSRPAAMAEAAKIAAGAGFPIVDVNLGCPAPKIRKQQAGAALLGDAVNLRKVARAVVAASPVPVTAKMRLGDDAGNSTLAAAKLLCEEGVAALTVHGRTLEQGLRGPVDCAAVKEVAAAAAVPLWANGGVETPQDAERLLEGTGAAGVMVGRAAVGKPYLIDQVEKYLAEGEAPAPPSRAALADAILFHFDKAASVDGEERAARQFRKHLLAYLKSAPGGKALCSRAAVVACCDDVVGVLDEFKRLPEYGPQ
ncbi:MAG: tRNA-dihydrouridine synthase [bacterium]